jgi:hypothetical protein
MSDVTSAGGRRVIANVHTLTIEMDARVAGRDPLTVKKDAVTVLKIDHEGNIRMLGTPTEATIETIGA